MTAEESISRVSRVTWTSGIEALTPPQGTHLNQPSGERMTYLEMVDAVNEATTDDARQYAQARLSGWIECANQHQVPWSGIEADNYTRGKHGDVPMCCGVLM